MNPSNNRSRRKRGKLAVDDNDGGLAPLVSRADAGRTDFQSRPQHHSYQKTDTYIPSSTRSNYNMSRDGPSSHADSQDRFYKHPSDTHHRSSRDEHDTADSKDSDHWGARQSHDTHNNKGSREWTTRDYGQGFSASYYRGDTQGWGSSDWYPDDRPHVDRESPDWKRAEQEDDRGSNWDNREAPRGRGNRRWQSDSGWDSRKRDRNQNKRPLDSQDESTQPKEDRSWEPGPGWQSRIGDNSNRSQRFRNNQGKNKGKKNNQNRQRQRGDRDRERDRGRYPDRRQGEDTLNNRSRSRSSSRSPDDRPRAKHRLPPATSINDISVSISQTTIVPQSELLGKRGSDASRNGKPHVNGKQRIRRPLSPEAERRGTPPSEKHSSTTTSIQHNNSAVSPTPIRHDRGSPTKARFGFTRSAGFKPIGQASTSVKMFFPQDDEEPETSRTSPREEPPPREVPVKRARKDIGSEHEEDKEPPQRTISAQKDDVVSLQCKMSCIEAQPPPSPVLRDATKAPPSPKPAGSGDVAISPGLRPRLPEPDVVDGFTRPSSPTATSPKELYAIVSQVGEGTFGKVYKARNTITNVHVALKRIRMEAERDGFPVTAMREIKLLQSLRHQNVVRLYEMMVSNGSVFMVFEYMDHDLTGVLSQTQFMFSEANLKSLCSQMLSGLAYLHHKGVIHRDIKGSNILINNRGELKLADFGLARFYQKRRRSDYTNRVITLWYRPPELLLGATVYGPEVDMWSAGCIMLELFTKKPIFQGNDEIHQLDVIYRIFGTPTPERWPGITELPWYELVKPKEVLPDHFRELFQRWLSPAALDLAQELLTYDPGKRVTAVQALEAPYFKDEQPPPELPVGLSSLEGEWHELETKRERAKKRRKLESALQHVV
ncbi:hypothetical protein ID866_5320 [Astraeus odoratus]|nr:hypothetical protein ID866_5320 [Astraeus odoratus]